MFRNTSFKLAVYSFIFSVTCGIAAFTHLESSSLMFYMVLTAILLLSAAILLIHSLKLPRKAKNTSHIIRRMRGIEVTMFLFLNAGLFLQVPVAIEVLIFILTLCMAVIEEPAKKTSLVIC